MISRAIWDFNGWDREEIHEYKFLAKGRQRRAKVTRIVGNAVSDANPGDTIRNTYVYTTFRVHIIREGGHHQLVPSVGRPGAVLFLLFIVYCLCILFFTMHGFRGFCQGRHQGEDVGKTV